MRRRAVTTVVEAGCTAFLAGQCPLDRSGALVAPGDLDAQIDKVAANALTALDGLLTMQHRLSRGLDATIDGLQHPKLWARPMTGHASQMPQTSRIRPTFTRTAPSVARDRNREDRTSCARVQP